jgi:hypothetical protein
MQQWSKRVIEEANLFNPAFCAALLFRAADGFTKKTHRPLPFALAFLVLPIVLHKRTRTNLPGSTITSILSWIQEHRDLVVGFATRAQHTRGITREAILFGVAHQILTFTDEGELATKRRLSLEKGMELFTNETQECVDRAAFIGRWFGAAGTTEAVYSAWGVSP